MPCAQACWSAAEIQVSCSPAFAQAVIIPYLGLQWPLRAPYIHRVPGGVYRFPAPGLVQSMEGSRQRQPG